jgi:diguanylate cyclase (GGDEF)-like protein
LGWQRLLALAVLLGAVAAVVYLDRLVSGQFDLRLMYFLIVLSAAVLLPRGIALGVAGAVAVVSEGVAGDTGITLLVNGTSHLLIYGYAALLTSNWETERRRLERMSRIDDLTGLYNLRALREQLPVWLGPALRTRRAMSVLMMDVDGFKMVNDRLGHATGNELLREVANLLRFSVRVGDLPFRFGGDEFVVLLSDADIEGALVVANRIQELYQAMGQTLRGRDVQVWFSIGIATFPSDGQTPDQLLARADDALYQAKHAGQGKVMHYQAEPAA